MQHINLIEDHHESLSIWRKNGFRNLDLVHIDAHIDFGFPAARPVRQVITPFISQSAEKTFLPFSP